MMSKTLKDAKALIRAFIRAHYSYEDCCSALAHCQSDRMSFYSCCCFTGFPTRDHAARGITLFAPDFGHYRVARMLPGALQAELAFSQLGHVLSPSVPEPTSMFGSDAPRRRRFASILRAEIRRRDRLQRKPCDEDCMMCSGEACGLCGAGCWDYNQRECDHDVIDRHNHPVPALAR